MFNGNILTYLRNGTTSGSNLLAMDDLTYHYQPGTNQLGHVDDAVSSGNYTIDIDDQNTFNYSYDEIGNLTSDVSEGITNIEWNVYGKIKSITKSSGTISYTYDASGNRISKTYNGKTTWYVRDASGNVMSVYAKDASVNNNHLTQNEVHLYGSSRLGILNVNEDLEVAPQPPVLIRGNKFFELSNHLGNVLVTVSDKKTQVEDGNGNVAYYTTDVITANDYYPFGMMMPERKFDAGKYRYGFNGKENDNDVKGEGNQQVYGMRIYDQRLGRFLSVDPITKQYPELTPYQFASNSPIQAIDLDGLEAFFIHGTASDPESWSAELTNFITENLTNNIHSDATFSWENRNSYLNNENSRKKAAFDLVIHIIDYRKDNNITDEEITLVGHSHGGNVAIQAAQYLSDIYGIIVNIVNFNTPAYNGSSDIENPQVAYGINQLINYWTKQDGVAGGLAGDDKYKEGVRTDVTNIELNNPIKKDPLRSHYQENINLEELKTKLKKPIPVPDGQVNPVKSKYNPDKESGSDEL